MDTELAKQVIRHQKHSCDHLYPLHLFQGLLRCTLRLQPQPRVETDRLEGNPSNSCESVYGTYPKPLALQELATKQHACRMSAAS